MSNTTECESQRAASIDENRLRMGHLRWLGEGEGLSLADIRADPLLRNLAQRAVCFKLSNHFGDLGIPLRVAFFDGDYF